MEKMDIMATSGGVHAVTQKQLKELSFSVLFVAIAATVWTNI